MSGEDDPPSHTVLQVLLVVLGALSVLLVLPFLQAVLAGGLLAYLVVPLSDRLSRRLGPTLGTLVTVVATVLVVLVPLLVLLVVAADQAVSLVQGTEVPDAAAVEGFVEDLLGAAVDLSTLQEPLTNAVETGFRGLLGRLVGVLGGIPGFLVGAVVFLFTFFYLLRDGDDLIAWLRRAAPLDPAVADELVVRTDDLLWAAVVGNVVVAALQAVLTVVAFVVLGFDNVVFLGVATFALSLLPLIGASVVWIPAVGYLVLIGRIPAALGLLVYGSIVVSGSDNFVRPMAMRRGADLNSGLLVLGIFGGVAVFGFLGLFVGPVVLGLAKEVVDLLVSQRGDPGGST